ncbi:MAG TPA: hypothetical protein VJI97_02615 [Candidatus Nanoarchaeia archaeon]|nr:hypothetical protein [Candidatus Nanoarchaeia archaeon]
MRCATCGASVKPWFEECYQCHNHPARNGSIPNPIAAKHFMREMNIAGWN